MLKRPSQMKSLLEVVQLTMSQFNLTHHNIEKENKMKDLGLKGLSIWTNIFDAKIIKYFWSSLNTRK